MPRLMLLASVATSSRIVANHTQDNMQRHTRITRVGAHPGATAFGGEIPPHLGALQCAKR